MSNLSTHITKRSCVAGSSPKIFSGRAGQRRPRRHHPFPRLLHGPRQGGQVAHLAAGPGVGLAVEVKLDVGEVAGGLPVRLAAGPEVAEEVRHGGGAEELGRAQRQAADGPEPLLELACGAGVEGEAAGAARRPSSERTAASGVTGKPAPARNPFSRSRCWVVWSTEPAGRTGACSAAASVAAAETFSNSKVTTSTPRAKPRTASRSS